MFRKILIANRSEIACRIIATCRRLGIATVAVSSQPDAAARHVALADEALPIGPAAPRDSYLRGDRIIAAGQATGAEAIHPGYRFLSENPDFVDQVAEAGLVFIGPSSAAIRAMGLKDAAKRLMAAAGVPVVPGWHGADQDPVRLAQEAAAIGYPVLVKAVAGGGGRGMRRVDRPADFALALDSAKAEARGAFGNDAVLIERYIERPHHIEVQVFGDSTDAVHLFERDCSLQRRHQKVIEEAPGPGMTPQVRAAMGDAAVRAARAIGYSGAGTVKFIVDGAGGLRVDGFWFMEMNTRLEVEHSVTEAITGVDLVEWQLRMAAGARLPMRQDALSITGHAFEARLCAEDVAAGFLPTTGRLAHLAFPADARAETGVATGGAIGPWYDPMIAKIITHGPTRAVALARLARVLEATQVAGTVTNLGFLARLARHPGFARGEVDTGLIARDLDALTSPRRPDALDHAMMAAAALAAAGLPCGPLAGFALLAPVTHQVALRNLELAVTAAVALTAPDTARVTRADTTLTAARRGNVWRIVGQPAMTIVSDGMAVHVLARGRTLSVTLPDPLARVVEGTASGNVTRAPMPGLVRDVAVAVGQRVEPGDRLLVVEAMKMEHVLPAARAGTVVEVLVSPGTQVEAGAVLIVLERE